MASTCIQLELELEVPYELSEDEVNAKKMEIVQAACDIVKNESGSSSHVPSPISNASACTRDIVMDTGVCVCDGGLSIAQSDEVSKVIMGVYERVVQHLTSLGLATTLETLGMESCPHPGVLICIQHT